MRNGDMPSRVSATCYVATYTHLGGMTGGIFSKVYKLFRINICIEIVVNMEMVDTQCYVCFIVTLTQRGCTA